jgi:hypothetical protein
MSSCKLWDTAYDFLSTTILKLNIGDELEFPTFNNLNRLKFGDTLYLRVIGIVSSALKSSNLNEDSMIPQLVLQSNSTVTTLLCSRLIIRCIKSTIASLISSTKPIESMKDVDRETFSKSIILLPGAGASEMGWSILWSCISNELSNFHSSSLNNDDSVDIDLNFKDILNISHKNDESYKELLYPLVQLLTKIIKLKIDKIHNKASLECIEICQFVSISYLQPPIYLMSNTLGSLDISSINRKIFDWQELFINSNSTSEINNINSVNGCIGWVMDNDLMNSSGSLCELKNPFSLTIPIVSSSNLFWSSKYF